METALATGNRLRAAVAAGDWVLAQNLLGEFRSHVESAWVAAATEDDRTVLKKQVEETMDWARKTAIAARSRDQRNLLHLIRGGAYSDAHPRPELFRLDA